MEITLRIISIAMIAAGVGFLLASIFSLYRTKTTWELVRNLSTIGFILIAVSIVLATVILAVYE